MTHHDAPAERTTKKNRTFDQSLPNVQEYTAALAQETPTHADAAEPIASVQRTDELQ
jgi:hypothetical protein